MNYNIAQHEMTHYFQLAISYSRLNNDIKRTLDVTTEGIFMTKPDDEVFEIMDKMILNFKRWVMCETQPRQL